MQLTGVGQVAPKSQAACQISFTLGHPFGAFDGAVLDAEGPAREMLAKDPTI